MVIYIPTYSGVEVSVHSGVEVSVHSYCTVGRRIIFSSKSKCFYSDRETHIDKIFLNLSIFYLIIPFNNK